jgi:hypothetical protein
LSNEIFVSFSGTDKTTVEEVASGVPKRLIGLYLYDFTDGASLLSEMERHVKANNPLSHRPAGRRTSRGRMGRPKGVIHSVSMTFFKQKSQADRCLARGKKSVIRIDECVDDCEQ